MQFTDARVEAVFAEYEARYQRELAMTEELPRGAFGQRRDEFLLPVGRHVGAFLHTLVAGGEAPRVLELGTSYGYSTLFLADAARESGATVISIDLDPAKQAYAAAMLDKAGLAGFVDFRCGDALELVAADPGPFNLVLLDIWKELYVPCFEAVYPKLAEEGLIVSDNMIYPEGVRSSARAYREAVKVKPDLQTMLLPLGSGIELSTKWSAGNPKL